MNTTIPTAYEQAVARNDAALAAQKSKALIPPPLGCGEVPDMAHCQSKEVYLAFRKEWRELYAWLSQATRVRRESYRVQEALSRLQLKLRGTVDIPGITGQTKDPVLEGQIASLQARAEKLADLTTVPPRWWTENVVDRFYVRSKHVASWLLEVRKQSKVQAQLGWVAAHPPRA